MFHGNEIHIFTSFTLFTLPLLLFISISFSEEYSEHIVWRKLDRKNSLISKGIHNCTSLHRYLLIRNYVTDLHGSDLEMLPHLK